MPHRVTAHPKVLRWRSDLLNQQNRMRKGTANEDETMNDSTNWTIVRSVDEQEDISIDLEMDQDFVIERYFADTPIEEDGEFYPSSQPQPPSSNFQSSEVG